MTISNPASSDVEPVQPVGFLVELTLSSGIGEAAQTQCQRNVEDFVASQGWQCSFSQWQGTVWDEHRDLTLADQCDLLSWLAVQPHVCSVVVSDLKLVDGIEDIEGRQLRMAVYTVATIAGTMLYRLGSIKPEVLAQVLGGFVEPHYDV